MTIEIRSFQPSDLQECQNLFKRAHGEYGNSNIFMDYVLNSDMKDIETNYLNVTGGHWWVAVSTETNQIVGQIAILPLKIADKSYYDSVPVDQRDRICELIRMGVNKEVQRLGVGIRLLTTLMDFARKNGYDKIHLTTGWHMDKARNFYEKNKFISDCIDKYLFDTDGKEGLTDQEKLASAFATRVRFNVGSIIPDEDQEKMKDHPEKSKYLYIQHYLRVLD